MLKNDTKIDLCIEINSNSVIIKPNEQLEINNQNIVLNIFPKVKTETKWLLNFAGISFLDEDDILCKIVCETCCDIKKSESFSIVSIKSYYVLAENSIFYNIFSCESDTIEKEEKYFAIKSKKAFNKYRLFFLFAEFDYFIPILLIALILTLLSKEYIKSIGISFAIFILLFRMNKFIKKYKKSLESDIIFEKVSEGALIPDDFGKILIKEIYQEIKRKCELIRGRFSD